MKRFGKIVGGSLVLAGAFEFTYGFATRPAKPKGEVPAQSERDGGVSDRYFRYSASNIPHPSKKHKGGEDAWLAQDNLLIVADGVGGWANRGVDPGLFSKELVANIKKLFDANNAQELKAVLVEAVSQTKNIGSSTCVLAKFDTSRSNFIKTTNLGDSGYMLFRPGSNGDLETVFRSKEQQYRFNFPYQCGTGADSASIAFDNEHEVKDRDIIVLGSDGMFDNLYNDDVAQCVKKNLRGAHLETQLASDCLADQSFKLGNKKGYYSPFAKGAYEAGLRYPHQGKSDDIAVVVAQIHQKSDSAFQEQALSTNGIGLKAESSSLSTSASSSS